MVLFLLLCSKRAPRVCTFLFLRLLIFLGDESLQLAGLLDGGRLRHRRCRRAAAFATRIVPLGISKFAYQFLNTVQAPDTKHYIAESLMLVFLNSPPNKTGRFGPSATELDSTLIETRMCM
jgi:hypothetical protein